MDRPPDLSKLFQQAQKMLAGQKELADRTYEGLAAAGLVKVVVTGAFRVKAVTINPEAIDPSDPELLEDLIMVATNNALQAASADATENMSKLTGGLDLGGLLG